MQKINKKSRKFILIAGLFFSSTATLTINSYSVDNVDLSKSHFKVTQEFQKKSEIE